MFGWMRSLDPRKVVSPLGIFSLMVALLFGVAPMAHALPAQGDIVYGDGAMAVDGNMLTVHQGSDALAIDWQSFSIGADEVVLFVQPGADAVALNRVLGADPSEILGQLSANGQVFLVNPHGVLFGQGAQVDVGALVASALDLSPQQFAAGDYVFQHGGAASELAGTVVNLGEITAQEGGYVAFLGTQIDNAGLVVAPLGTIAIGAGERITLGLDASGFLSLSVDEAALQALIESKGVLAADGGLIMFEAQAQDALQDAVVNLDGIVRAQAVDSSDGMILLSGGSSGVVNVHGQLDVSGRDVGEQGGRIQVTGEYIALGEGARLDASGTAGGGAILIGGDYQGANPDVANATALFVAKGAHIDASATTDGDGGRVIVWSDDLTRFFGTIAATGGVDGGDGGFAEVSSRGQLDYGGGADLRAASGKAGTLLLDPSDIIIRAMGEDRDIGWDSDAEQFGPTGDGPSILSVATLLHQLELSDVIIATGSDGPGAGDITVSDNIYYEGTADRSLSLRAHRSIAIDNDVEIIARNAALDLILHAAFGHGEAGNIRIGQWVSGVFPENPVVTIDTNGGDIVLGGGELGADGRPAGAAHGFAFGSGDNAYKHGIHIYQADLNAGAGSISLHGRGSLSFITAPVCNGACELHGVVMRGATMASTDGGISIVGHSGGGGRDNHGVSMTPGTVLTSGSGDIVVSGHGYILKPDNFGGFLERNYGVYFGDGGLGAPLIETTSGNISVTGESHGIGSNYNNGIYGRGLILKSASGDIALHGTGARGSFTSVGIELYSGSLASIPYPLGYAESETGNVTFHGVDRWSMVDSPGCLNCTPDGQAIRLYNGYPLVAPEGTVTIIGDSINDDAVVYFGQVQAQNLVLKGRSDFSSVGYLTSTSHYKNLVGTLAADVKSLRFVNEQDLIIGTVDGVEGITASGHVQLGVRWVPKMGEDRPLLSVTQDAPIRAGGLELLGEDYTVRRVYDGPNGNFVLNHADNKVDYLVGDVKRIRYSQVDSLTISSYNRGSNTIPSQQDWIHGLEAADSVLVMTGGDLLLRRLSEMTGGGDPKPILPGPVVTAGGEGNALVLVAGGSVSIASAIGDTPFWAPNGRYLVYSTDPSFNELGEFESPGDLFNRTYADNPPETIGAGDWMIYAGDGTDHPTYPVDPDPVDPDPVDPDPVDPDPVDPDPVDPDPVDPDPVDPDPADDAYRAAISEASKWPSRAEDEASGDDEDEELEDEVLNS